MNKVNRKIPRLFLPAFLSMISLLVSGCANDEAPDDFNGDNAIAGYPLTIKISASSPSLSRSPENNTHYLGSRDGWDAGYISDSGSQFDNHISKISVFLLPPVGIESDDNQDWSLSVSEFKPITDSEGNYVFTAMIPSSSPMLKFKNPTSPSVSGRIVVVANSPKDISRSPFPEDPFSIAQLNIIQGSNSLQGLPMWGVKEINDMPLTLDYPADAGMIYLLRSVAKCKVKLNENSKSRYEITSVKLSSQSPEVISSHGFVIPSNAGKIHNTLDLDQEECFNPVRKFGSLNELAFDEYNGEYSLYLGETELGKDYSAFIDVQVKDREGQEGSNSFEGRIFFSTYSSDNYSPLDPIERIVRNHIYEFTISVSPIALLPEVKIWEFGGKAHLDL